MRTKAAPSEQPRLDFESARIDLERAVAMDLGIGRSNASAKSEAWYGMVPAALLRLKSRQVSFSADDVWDELERGGQAGPFAHSAGLGQILRSLSREGRIRKVGLHASRRLTAQCHAKLHVLWMWVE